MSDFLSWIPNILQQQIAEELVNSVVGQVRQMTNEQIANNISRLLVKDEFRKSIEYAIRIGIERFFAEYSLLDEDVTELLRADNSLFESPGVQYTLLTLVRNPGITSIEDLDKLITDFQDVLPNRVNRERVNKAVFYLLRCIVEEIWNLPGTKETRGIYSLQFQQISAEHAREQFDLARRQLELTAQLNFELRQAFVQLTTSLENRFLSDQSTTIKQKLRPYHNLPLPDYTHFVGRRRELAWLRERLSPRDRAWQIAIIGTGGVGKSALALNIAHDLLNSFEFLSPEERFEAFIWVSAKEQIMTPFGRERAKLSSITLRSLEDVFTTVAITFEREDIIHAMPDEQAELVNNILQNHHTLLVVDNFENVNDERINTFLRNLPSPSKAIITSRERIDLADVQILQGFDEEEADQLITEEAHLRRVRLSEYERRQIYYLTSGIPLPIKLAISRFSLGESPESIARWLGNAVGDLTEYCVSGQAQLAKQRDPNSWQLLIACSLFEQNFGASQDALRFISDLSTQELIDGLNELQRLCLINRSEDDNYWVAPLVQRYILRKFTENEPLSPNILARLSNYISENLATKPVDLYAIVKIENTESNKLLVGERYNLIAGVSRKRLQGFISTNLNIELPEDRYEIEFLIIVRGDFSSIDEWQKPLRVDMRYFEMQTANFTVLFENEGVSKVFVDFYYQRHWLQTIKLDLIVEKVQAEIQEN